MEPIARAKKIYVLLDGMRGAAAIVVMMHHLWPMAMGEPGFRKGYLAVDFFFLLSGFVIAKAYEPRIGKGLSLGAFMAARLRRLYPATVVGLLMGSVLAIAYGSPILMVIPVLVPELFFIPRILSGSQGLFALNGPQWSLLLELFANVFHHRFLAQMAASRLALMVVSLGLAYVAIGVHYGKVEGGDCGVNFLPGIVRVLFPYTLGVMIARWHGRGWVTRELPIGIAAIAALPALLIIAGWVPGEWDGWWVDLSMAMVLFPLLLIWGVNARLGPIEQRVALAAGALSFPLYAVHVPVAGLIVAASGQSVGKEVILGLAMIAALVAARFVQRLTSIGFLSTAWAKRLPTNGDAVGATEQPALG